MSKYHAKRTTVDGITFDSTRESQRYSELKLLERAGEITHLELQPRYDIIVNDKNIGFYKADFKYWDVRAGKYIIEDVKGVRTSTYRLKKKLVEALYYIEITEVA